MKSSKLFCISFLIMIISAALMLSGCSTKSDSGQETEAPAAEESSIDYMVLVNKENSLPDGWDENLELVDYKDSQGWDVKTEKKAYDAYLELKKDLENEDFGIDLDSAYRSAEEQQRVWDEFMEKYGEAYTKKTVAPVGCSEHQSGLALDLYLNIDGKDVYLNEEMVKYPEIWAVIHEKLADHGFILRYLPGKKDITGYGYEPWHIRYIGDVDAAKEIMSKGITFEEYLGKIPPHAATVDYGTSDLYSQEEMDPAITEFKKEFEQWDGCELHSVKYAGDECNSEENLKWLNSLADGGDYTQCIEFLTDFHSPVLEEQLEGTAWEPDHEYADYQWWLARKDGGDWELVSWGY